MAFCWLDLTRSLTRTRVQQDPMLGSSKQNTTHAGDQLFLKFSAGNALAENAVHCVKNCIL